MARLAKASKSTKSATPARKTGRSPAIEASKPASASKLAASRRSPAAVTRAPATPPAPKVSKDELRAHIEKLEQLVATLRAKSRETNKAAKAATARIAELEAQVAQLEKKAAAAPAPVREPKPAKPARTKNQPREIDPGDAVPPGVAVQEAEPLDGEAETALENLETHLGHE